MQLKRFLILGILFLLIEGGCQITRTIKVDTIPSDASVSIDGRQEGTTPFNKGLTFPEKNSRYHFVFQKPGFEMEKRTVDYFDAKAAPDPWILQTIELKPLVIVKEMAFMSIPDGALISIDGVNVGKTNGKAQVKFVRSSTQSPWSAPKVRITIDNYAPYVETLSLQRVTEKPEVHAILIEIARERWVTINANVGATVKVDGKIIGSTPQIYNFRFTRSDERTDWTKSRVEVYKEGYRHKKDQTLYTEIITADDLGKNEVMASFEKIPFVPTILRRFQPTAKGVEIVVYDVLSQVGEIEKEPKARSVTRITDADPSDPFVESRVSVLPDGEQIVYSFPVWKEVPQKGREAEQRKNLPDVEMVKRTPVGANIWMRRGNAVTRMTDGEFFDIDPTVTADGKWIYFCSDRLGRMNIWRIQTQGKGGLTKITDSPSVMVDMEPSISPGGDKIVYTSLLTGSNVYQIWFANSDGTLPTQIRTGRSPVWSPNGKKVAYVASDPISKKEKIWVMDADGGNPTQLTRGADSNDRYPVWTPDGTRIIYASDRALNEDQEPNFDIWMMNEDGTGITQLTVNGSYDSRPAVSHDAKYIYFISNRGAQSENQETLQIWRIEF